MGTCLLEDQERKSPIWALRAKTHSLILLHILHWFTAIVFLDRSCKINFSVLYPSSSSTHYFLLGFWSVACLSLSHHWARSLPHGVWADSSAKLINVWWVARPKWQIMGSLWIWKGLSCCPVEHTWPYVSMLSFNVPVLIMTFSSAQGHQSCLILLVFNFKYLDFPKPNSLKKTVTHGHHHTTTPYSSPAWLSWNNYPDLKMDQDQWASQVSTWNSTLFIGIRRKIITN